LSVSKKSCLRAWFPIMLLFRLRRPTHAQSMVKKFIKLHLLALLYASLCFLAQIVWMREEY